MLIPNNIAESYKSLDNISLQYKLYVIKDLSTTEIDNDDIKAPITTEDGVLVNPIGKVPLGTITANIRGELAKEYYEDEGYKIKFDVFVPSQFSITSKEYIVKKATYDKRSDITTFEGVDKVNLLVSTYKPLLVNYPISLKDWLIAFIGQFGLTINTNDLNNMFQGSFILNQEPNLDETYTNLDVLSRVSAMTLSYIYIDFFGELRIKGLDKFTNDNSIPDYVIEGGVKDLSVGSDRFKTLGVNRLVLSLDSQIEGEVVVREDPTMQQVDGVVELRLDDLPFVPTEVDKELVIDNMFNKIKGFKYKSYELESKYWFFELGDLINQTADGNYNVGVFRRTTRHQGSAMTVIEAVSDSVIESDFNAEKTSPSKKTEIRVDKVEGMIENIVEDLSKIDGNINLIYNLSMTVGDYYGWDWENTDSIPLILPFAYKFNLQYGTNFEIVNIVGSRSKTGQSFFNNGTAISPYAYVRGGMQYSGRIKITEGHGLTIEVREYNIDQELIKTTPFNFEDLGFHDFTITSSENTKLIRLAYIVDGVSIANRVIVADSIFNRGQPRNWEETPDDFKFWTRSQILQLSDSISSTVDNLLIVDGRTQANKSQILQQADRITSTVERIDVLGDEVDANKSQILQQADMIQSTVERIDVMGGEVETNRSSITQTAEQIELKVNKGDIASTINTTAQSVTIDSSKINLTGFVTVTDLSGSGTTTIDGSNISTGVIKSNNNKTKLDLDSGTFLIGNSPSDYKLYFDGTNLNIGGGVISWANLSNKPFIPGESYITQITENTITTEYINAKNITARHLESGTITIGTNAFTVNTAGYLSAGRGGFKVPPTADGVYNNFGGYARWKLDDGNYILQGTNHIGFYFSNEGQVFSFNRSGATNFSLQMGSLNNGVTMSVGDNENNQLQIRDATDSVYMDIASSDFVISSSEEFKQKIKPTNAKLDMVKNTNVFDFEYKEPLVGVQTMSVSSQPHESPTKIGFIAEESPKEMVMPLKQGEIGVSMTNTVGILWKAVQELSAEVDKLKGVK